MRTLLLTLLLALPAALPAAEDDFLMGSVVKSDKWKMDRANDREIFDGDVSFRNPRYTLKADHALYARPAQTWNVQGNVSIVRRFDDRSQVEVTCDRAVYMKTNEEAFLERGALPVRMKYISPDARVLRGRARSAKAEYRTGMMYFDGDFSLSTDNLDMFSGMGLYNNSERSFTMHDSTPVAIGTREGYDFAISSSKMKFFRDSRDIKFYNNVAGWVKDVPPPAKKP
jgi:hypothetical protein